MTVQFYRFAGSLLVSDVSLYAFGLLDFFFLLSVSKPAAAMVGYAEVVVATMLSLFAGHLMLYINEIAKEASHKGTMFTTAMYSLAMCVLAILAYTFGLKPLFRLAFEHGNYLLLTHNLNITVGAFGLMLLVRQADMTVRIRVKDKGAVVSSGILIASLALNTVLNYVLLFKATWFAPEQSVAIATVISRTCQCLALLVVLKSQPQTDIGGFVVLGRLCRLYAGGGFNIGLKNALEWATSVVAGALIASIGGPAALAYQAFLKMMTMLYRLPQALVAASHVHYLRQAKPSGLDIKVAKSYFLASLLPTVALFGLVFVCAPLLVAAAGLPSRESSFAVWFLRIELALVGFYLFEQFGSTILVANNNTPLMARLSWLMAAICIPLMLWFGLHVKSAVGVVASECAALVVGGVVYGWLFVRAVRSTDSA